MLKRIVSDTALHRASPEVLIWVGNSSAVHRFSTTPAAEVAIASPTARRAPVNSDVTAGTR